MSERTYDHSAPWRCSLPGCARCEHKPTYGDWWVSIETGRRQPQLKLVQAWPRCTRCGARARYETPQRSGGPLAYWCMRHRPAGMLARGYVLELEAQ